MSFVYLNSEPGLWTTGFYDPNGRWHADKDFNDPEDAAGRCAWLNGHQKIAQEYRAALAELEERR